jgi:hypothetical protein
MMNDIPDLPILSMLLGSVHWPWATWNMVRDSRDTKLVARSLGWPEAKGTVISSKVVWAHVEVEYEYSVASGGFTGRYNANLPVSPPDRGAPLE